MGERIDIVAIKNGNVVAMSYSDDGGPDDREFIANHPSPAYSIEYMPVSEAARRHLEYIATWGGDRG